MPKSSRVRPATDTEQFDAAVPADAAVPDRQPDAQAPTNSDPMDAGPRTESSGDAAIPTSPSDASTLPTALPAAGGAPQTSPSDAGMPDASAGRPGFVAADTLAASLVRAGEPIAVTCLLLDEAQQSYVPARNQKAVPKVLPEGAAAVRDDGALVASRAGEISVACTFPDLGVFDSTPATVKILPGSAARVTAHVDRALITAGESVATTCDVFDAWGNAVGDRKPTLRAIPTDERNSLNALVAAFTRAGAYDVYCVVDGAESTPAKVEVRPSLPSTLQVARVPDRTSYAIGEAIELTRAVADRFGNPIVDAKTSVESVPAGTVVSNGRFSYSKAGQYRLTATVAPPTDGDVVLSKSLDVLVDATGPAIACDSPADGDILTLAPGAGITLRGSVTDPSGVAELRVNGVLTAVDAAGHFAVPTTGQFGVNFVDMVALDGGGRKTTRVCAFLLANRWAADDTSVEDTLSLRLRQLAIDDASRDDLDSLADVLAAALSSSGLRDAVHGSLMENPVLKSGCDQSLGNTCLLRSDVTYLDTRIDGPNSTGLTLVEGGLSSASLVKNLRVKVRFDVQIPGGSYQTEGWFIFQSIGVDTIFDVEMLAGQPRVRVRPGSTSSSVGRIDTEFPGLDGEILAAAVALSGSVLRNYIAMRIEAYVTDNLGAVLDGAVSGLDVRSLDKQFNVGRLDSGAPIPLHFGAQFSSVSTDSERMLFGMGTRFAAPVAHAKLTLGAPIPTTAHLLSVSGSEPLGVAVHDSVFNQGLHALWHAGYFDAALDSKASDLGLPEGMQVSFSTELPPAAEIAGDRIKISLGRVLANLSYPGTFSSPVPMTVGAKASMSAHLVGNSLVFDGFAADEIHLSVDGPDVDIFTRTVLEAIVPSVLEYVISSTLADALPALPVPSLSLPSTITSYGLPNGAALGIAEPVLSMEAPHIVLRGNSTLAPQP